MAKPESDTAYRILHWGVLKGLCIRPMYDPSCDPKKMCNPKKKFPFNLEYLDDKILLKKGKEQFAPTSS